MPKYVLWSNRQLPLMPAPDAVSKPATFAQTCSYCGGREVSEKPLPPPARINGKRIPQAHKDCIESAKNPLFDMNAPGILKRVDGN